VGLQEAMKACNRSPAFAAFWKQKSNMLAICDGSQNLATQHPIIHVLLGQP